MPAPPGSSLANFPLGVLNGEQIWMDTGATNILFAAVNVTASADIVALTAAKKIRVLGVYLLGSAGVTFKLTDGTNTVDITGPFSLTVGAPVNIPPSAYGIGETAAGGKLSCVQVGAGTVAGYVVYVLH